MLAVQEEITDEPGDQSQTVRVLPRFLRLASGWATPGMLVCRLRQSLCFLSRLYLMSRMRRRTSAHPFHDCCDCTMVASSSWPTRDVFAAGQTVDRARGPLLGHFQHMCSQSGPCPGAHGPHQGQSAVSGRPCLLTAAPAATANLCPSVPISLRVKEHLSSLFVCMASPSGSPAIKQWSSARLL